MNIQSKSPRSSVNWKQISIIAIVLGIAAFQYINNRQDAANQNAPETGSTAQLDSVDHIDLGGALKDSGKTNQNNSQSKTSKPDLKFKPIQGSTKPAPEKVTQKRTASEKSSSSKPYLQDGQRGKKVSPAGLIYNSSRSGEHRTEHVLRHASDMPNRPGNHGVFDVDGDDVFRLLDEAYKMIQSNSRQVSKDRPREGEEYKTAYVINMNRRIGYRGGKSGNRAGKPKLSKIKLVLANGNQVITAYPF